MKRHRYQYGSLTKKNNRLSEDVWQFRFYETTPEGHRYRRSTTIGTVAQYPTKTHALRIIEPLRLRLNLHHRFGRPISIGALIDHYVERELPERRHSTQQSHSSTLKRWILPRWGDRPLEEVKPVAVEEWLRSLTLAPKTKVNLRSLFHLIYEHARRWELTDRNPIDLVRQRGGRRCIPRVLTPGEIRLLLAQLVEPYHTMVVVAACLGLRASEIVGLQWQDLNWEDLTVLIRRGVVSGRSGDTKTEASQKSLPIDPRLARSLQELWKRSLHKGPQDWYAQTDAADQAMSALVGNASKPSASRTYARELVHRKDKIGSKEQTQASDSTEASLRQKRRERLKAVSDEALIDLDDYTVRLIAKRK